MAMQLADDFREFLRLLNSNGVDYLLIGGYAVGVHGYVRATGDMDVWIRRSPENARRVEATLREFGFAVSSLTADLFLAEDNVVRMGVPPNRLEILTSISGADFGECFPERVLIDFSGIEVPVISLSRLRQNKRSAGRSKDLADLDHLPGGADWTGKG